MRYINQEVTGIVNPVLPDFVVKLDPSPIMLGDTRIHVPVLGMMHNIDYTKELLLDSSTILCNKPRKDTWAAHTTKRGLEAEYRYNKQIQNMAMITCMHTYGDII